jgi:organic hydroperoxide reductase OsmC/OhrA
MFHIGNLLDGFRVENFLVPTHFAKPINRVYGSDGFRRLNPSYVLESFVKPKKVHKSFHYRAKTIWDSARRGMLSVAGRPNIVVGSPPEFKGEMDVWAPEELLVGALNTCTMLTFLSLAQARGLIPAAYESEAEGLLENIDGKYRITEVAVSPRVTLNSEAELEPARATMESVEAYCFIANSINSKVTLAPEFIVATPPK